jgi:hypothetical protein
VCPGVGTVSDSVAFNVQPRRRALVRQERVGESGLRKVGPERADKPTKIGAGHGRQK